MKTHRYALPAVAALTLHTFFFFGFARPVSTGPTASETVPSRLPPTMPPAIVEMVPLEEQENTGEKPDRRHSAVELPRAPDFPQLTNPGDIVIPTEPYNPVIRPEATHIGPQDNTMPMGPQPTGREMDEVVGSMLLDNKPRTTMQSSPEYPYTLKQEGITGTVEVEFVVDRRGRVHDVRVVRATRSEFAEPTRRAVESWRFEPGTRCGTPVSFRMRVPVVFNLDK